MKNKMQKMVSKVMALALVFSVPLNCFATTSEEKATHTKIKEDKTTPAQVEINFDDLNAQPKVLGNERTAALISILDSIIEPRPAILMVILATRDTAIKICTAIKEREDVAAGQSGEKSLKDLEDDKRFIESQKKMILKMVQRFLGIVQENAGMIRPIVEESLGRTSESLEPFLCMNAEDLKSIDNIKKIFETVDTIEKLKALAFDVAIVTKNLAYDQNLKKSYPAYIKFLKEKAEKK